MKYNFSLKKYWWYWFKQDLKRFYYSKMCGFTMSGVNGTLLPITGKGEYVSVYTKGQIIQIKDENNYHNLEFDEIRIIPYQPNHGVMIERCKNGIMRDRHLLDIEQFNKSVIFVSNIEKLISNKKYNET
jgi:hypothetical protein